MMTWKKTHFGQWTSSDKLWIIQRSYKTRSSKTSYALYRFAGDAVGVANTLRDAKRLIASRSI